MQGCALLINSVYTGWVNEEYEYIQGRGGEGLRLGNLEDEDGNRDNNEGREGEGWYNDNVIDGKKCDEEGKEHVGNNHGSLLLLLLSPQMDLSLVPLLVKIWDSLMGKCLAQHLE